MIELAHQEPDPPGGTSRSIRPPLTGGKMAFWVCLAASVGALISAGSASAAGDPRRCDAGHRTGSTAAEFCAGNAAKLVARRRVGTARMVYQGPMTCEPIAKTMLVWRCDYATGKATVTFRALSNGWHIRVQLAS